MKTLVLFHRLELTDLFAPIGGTLVREFRIIHLAYSASEVARLRELGVTQDIVVFKDRIRALWDEVTPSPALLREIDELFIAQTGGAFTLNSAIQSDRGFSLLEYKDALRLTAVYYRFWTELDNAVGLDAVLHEPCSLMFNFVAAMVCARRGGRYLYPMMVPGRSGELRHMFMTGFDFACPELELAIARIGSGEIPVDVEASSSFLENFRADFAVFLGDTFARSTSLLRLALGALLQNLLVPQQNLDPVLDNIDYWQSRQNYSAIRLRNLIRYRLTIKFDEFDPEQRFFFFPLHLEPEAVVLYHGHGIYTNQVKLVQNIAAQLPPGTLLYVKDHPHDFGYRTADDYLAIKQIPNIRLLDNKMSGKQIIRHARGVITLCGTAGFEALLMGKQVYCFAKTFYSPCSRVTYIHNIRELRAAIYAQEGVDYPDDSDLHAFLTAYRATAKPGLTDYFGGRARKHGIDLEENATRVAHSLKTVLERSR